ncbi:molybdopterin-dependent oxidoreductase [Desulfosediminicola flagellatus]|uniref:molybdopterin-dependent oxidoreductase n=1 Tax=Desulfosediminicola flagellatus TaxID=2569541 RepID=UPI0010AD50C3|nr:molybdopterin-dependent oxidoreductase [Desulfosediminicola flagellatus]
MGKWQKTGCVLCAQNCGLLVNVSDNQIVQVKGDPENPRSKGYLCRKGSNIANFQHHADRLKTPLKKTDKGFVEISWEQAYREIGIRLREIVDEYGPESFALIGGGGQGSHFDAGFSTSLMHGLGSKYHYNALAQELTGYFWCSGRLLGRQNRFPIPDEHNADMILGIGWNGMVSHQMPRAPLVIKEFARNPDKFLAVIDPRKSEIARVANLHLAITPGSDALLARAMIAVILSENWEDSEYLAKNTTGLDSIRGLFDNFDIQKALTVCGVEYSQVKDLCRELSTRKWCMHTDLGVIMNRHSTLASYLYMLLAAVCGRLCVSGGLVIPGNMLPLGAHSDERLEKTWRTKETDFPAIFGLFPPNVFPEEVLSDHAQRLRAVVVSTSNPLRAFADTYAWEKAFEKLDLKVTVEIAMTETAELSDYVLPAQSPYESHDASFFTWTHPEVYFQMRHPLIEPTPETKETGLIHAEIADAAGIVPDLPDYLYSAAKKDRVTFTAALLTYLQRNKKHRRLSALIIAKARAGYTDSNNLDAMWGILLSSPRVFRKNAARAGFPIPSTLEAACNIGKLVKAFKAIVTYRSLVPLAILSPRIAHAELMFDAILKNRSGLWVGKAEDDNMKGVATKDRKIHLYIEEMEKWITEITPEAEEKALMVDPIYPFILNAGRHLPQNANNLMRKPDWNKDKRTCTLAMNPADAKQLSISDGEFVKVTTEAASERIELEISDDVRVGQVLIPHGFGLKYNGVTHGMAVNKLTKNSHRDRLAGTPIHRYVPCRVEKEQTE